jgi:hypothetical protein
MHNDPIYLLEPVFHFLDMMIHDYGDVLYMLLVYASIPLIALILSTSLRRRQARSQPVVTIPIIVIRQSVEPPPLPPSIQPHDRRPSDDDSQWVAA